MDYQTRLKATAERLAKIEHGEQIWNGCSDDTKRYAIERFLPHAAYIMTTARLSSICKTKD